VTAVGRPPGALLARLPRPRCSDPVRLAVIADPHVAQGTGTWKCRHRSRELFARAVAGADGADATVLAGDLTGDGRRESFDAVDAELAALDEPSVAVPGNHDVPKLFDDHEGVPAGTFERQYTPGLPSVTDVGPVTLVGVDSATAPDGSLRGTWGGRVGPDTREWLDETLPALEPPVAVVVHHNLAALPENPGGKWTNFPLRDATAVRDLLAEHDIRLAISAHHHVPAVARHGPTNELIVPAVCSFPQAMLRLRIGPDGTTAWLVPLATPPELRAAYFAALSGKPLGVGILRMVEQRLDRLPLVEEPPDRPV
jgi:Icc protein